LEYSFSKGEAVDIRERFPQAASIYVVISVEADDQTTAFISPCLK
jgi:hypothetical protein